MKNDDYLKDYLFLFDDVPSVITSKNGQEEYDFYAREFLYEIFRVMTHYLRFSKSKAEKTIRNSNFFPVEQWLDSDSNWMFYHETSYHWALFYAFGQGYWWEENGYEQNYPLDYNEQTDNFEREFQTILALENKHL